MPRASVSAPDGETEGETSRLPSAFVSLGGANRLGAVAPRLDEKLLSLVDAPNSLGQSVPGCP
jgi:hypothetical protein